MYPVSKKYTQEMRAPIREARVRATVYFGMFDRTASGDATLSWSSPLSISQPSNLNSNVAVTDSYATFEPDQLRLDGAQILMPTNVAALRPQGFISTVVAGVDGVFDAPPYIDIMFTQKHSMVGLTLHFDNAYDLPSQITVLSYADEELLDEQTVTDITSRVFSYEFLLDNIDRIVIRFDQMHHEGIRARLNKIEFGIGYTYSDSDLRSLTEKHTGSPLSMMVPTSSLSFVLLNENERFDVDSETALQRFLANGQPGVIDYLFDLGTTMQRIPGGIWSLAKWKVQGYTAEFTMENSLAPLTKTKYSKSLFYGISRTLYSLAEDVFADAGVTNYYIDPYLQNVTTLAPLPIDTHAACLQMIANAGRCRLYVDRENTICIERIIPDLMPTASSTTPQLPFSDAGTVPNDDNVTYAVFEPSFIRLDGSQILVPEDEDYDNAGWIVSAVSDEEGTADENELVLSFDDPTNVFSVNINWGSYPPPLKARLSCREDGVWKSETYIEPSQSSETYGVHFRHCDAIKLEVTSVAVPGQRVRVLSVKTSMMSDFVLSKDQILGNPIASMEPKLRNVVAKWRVLTAEVAPSEITSVDILTNSGWYEVTHDLCLIPDVVVEDAGITIEQQHYAYVSYIRLTSETATSVTATIMGLKINEAERSAVSNANDTGEDLPIENPLFTSEAVAQDVADWTRDYYSGRVLYDVQTRGFPEIDNFDILYLWDGGSATINSSELTYNGAFRQQLKLRRR